MISFLHRYVAGLRLLDPGYRTFRIAPRPGGGITSARVHHDAPHGRIEVAWQVDGSKGTLATTIPASTVAEVALPEGQQRHAGRGRHRFTRTTDERGTDR